MLSLLVAQRTREIGIRMALGAAPGRVRALVLRDTLVPALIGCVTGGVLAVWAARGIAAQLFGVTPGDPATFAGVVDCCRHRGRELVARQTSDERGSSKSAED